MGGDIIIGLKYLPELLKDYKECSLLIKIREIRQELKWAWQRAWKGYDDSFWWGMDENFTVLYKELLKELRNNLYSHPNTMTFEEWEQILDEMICLLDNMSWSMSNEYEIKIKNKNRFFELFSKHFYDLWD